MRELPRPIVCSETKKAVAELACAGEAVASGFRELGGAVREHRTRVALHRLMWEHERQVAELRDLVRSGTGSAGTGSAGKGSTGEDGATGQSVPAPIAVAEPAGGSRDPRAVLAAARRTEAELLALYERRVASYPAEPVRAVLLRHRRVIAAHVAWLRESGHWKLMDRVARLRSLGSGKPLKPAAA